jgi:hypothetical protein
MFDSDLMPILIIGALIFAAGLGIGFFVGKGAVSDNPGAAVTAEFCSEKFACVPQPTNAQYAIVGEFSASGTSLIGLNPKIQVRMKNTGNEVAEYRAIITCETLNKGKSDITSAPQYVGPGQEGTFLVEYPVSWKEEYKCENYRATGSKIQGCMLVTK